MKYNLHIQTIESKPGMLYGKLTDLDGNCKEVNVLVNILDSVYKSKGDSIENSAEVLKWIYENCKIVHI